MATKTTAEMEVTKTTEQAHLAVEGLALLETLDTLPEDMKLTAYVFDPLGKLLGSAPLDAKGRFNVPVALDRPADVQLFVGPADKPDVVRASSVYKENFHAKDWVPEGHHLLLKPRIFVRKDFWALWYPIPIAVTGHVRTTAGKPIPFLKVEIFDVDREPFLWPYLVNKAAAPGLKVVHIPELLEAGPLPHPGPPPDLVQRFGPMVTEAEAAAAVPEATEAARFLEAVSISPQPEPPTLTMRAETRVGEMVTAAPEIAEKLEKLTLTSRLPIWLFYPFYSKQLVDTVYTDYAGFFSSCFKWWPVHLRRGRLRFDSRPDIIMRVTQVIDGVEKVLYMDPYTSTRWNVTNTHIDLWLDDPEIVPGSGVSPEAPAGMQTFFTRVGNDEVFHIDQTTGLYNSASYTNVAYGTALRFHGQFGKNLTAGTTKRYYRLSYRKGATGNFTPITAPLTDTRVNAATLTGQTCFLGPNNVNGTMALYEIRDLDHYYWYNPDWLVEWNTPAVEAKTGVYTLRLEVFDDNGQPLATVDYRDGTVPTALPHVTDCDLVLAVHNVAPTVDLQVPGVPITGVIPWTPALSINLTADVSQENGRLHGWGLQYVKGLDPTVHALPAGGWYNAGIPAATQNVSIPVSSMGITSSTAVAFKLWAWSHVRNGYSMYVYYNEEINAVAIEKCPGLAATLPVATM